jgi:sodium-dependent dicarboxylate transporter 2/3/5
MEPIYMNNLAHSPPDNRPLTRRNLLIILLTTVLFFLLIHALPYPTATNRGLAIMVAVSILWLSEALHSTITALLVPLLAVLTGQLTVVSSYQGFASPIIFLFFGGFALACALRSQQLDSLLANRLLSLTHGDLRLTVMMLFALTAFISMWINNTATVAIMLPLALGIISKLEAHGARRTQVFILLGIAYSSSIGGMGTLIGCAPNLLAAAPLGLDFLGWIKLAIPVMLLLMPLMILTLWIVFRPNLEQRIAFSNCPIAWTATRLMALAIFIITALCWILSSQLSQWLGGIAHFDSLIALISVLLITCSGVASWRQIQQSTEWGVLLLFGGGLTLSTVLRDSGASEVLAQGLATLLQGCHGLIIMLAVATFIVFITEFTSNTASTALMVPIFISVAQYLALPPLTLTMIIGIGASCAFMLPVGTPPNAMVYGSGDIRQREMIHAGLILNLICIVVLGSLAWFYWR